MAAGQRAQGLVDADLESGDRVSMPCRFDRSFAPCSLFRFGLLVSLLLDGFLLRTESQRLVTPQFINALLDRGRLFDRRLIATVECAAKRRELLVERGD